MSVDENLKVETSEGVRGLRRGVEQNPDDANAHLLLGSALAEAGQPAEALGHLQRSVELDLSLVRGHIRLGNLLREFSRTGEALVARATGWFEAPERLAKLVDGLRGRLQRSPLMDHAGYARNFAEALEGIVTA